MKGKKITAVLCALAVVVSSSGGLPFGGLRLFDTAIVASAADFEGDGSATSPYLIASAADWNALADAVNSGESYSGKYFKLTEDISVSTMIGKNSHGGGSHIPFSGTFDGDGHVLTVNINSTSTHGAAPFCGVQNAVIKNLKVEGSVVGGIHSSGLVGTTSSNDSGTLTIEKVVVNVDVSGNTHLGGVVGHGFGTNITLKNVSYGGKIAGTSFSGGLVGWCGPNAMLTAENCSFSGTYSGGFHPIGFAYSSGTAKVTNFYTTIAATNTSQNQYTYTDGLTQNKVSITAPTSKTNLTSSGDDVELINVGSTDKGTMKYSLDGMTYSEEIPKAAAGEHSVWYRVEVNGNYISEKRIKVNVVHAHAFTYSADGNTITAKCNSDCDITDDLTMTISAPTDLKADGSPKKATLSTGYNTTAFPGTYTIEYYKGEEKLDGAPSAGGHYTAKVTAGTATASVDFTIVVDPTYTITIPESVNIDGGKAEFKAENVTLPDGAKINITVDGENTESGQTTFNAKNEAGNSTVSYTINNGSADVADGGTALTFTESSTQTLTFTKASDPTYAGKHTETLTFGVVIEQSEPATVAVSSITIDNAPTEALFVNSTGTLTATVSPDNATDKTVVWSSSDSDYVSINAETGEYTVMGKKGYGSATITATATNGTEDTSDDVKATCTITGKVTYTSLSVGTVLHTGDTFYTGSTVYFQGSTAASFTANMGVITIIEATKSGYNNKYYQCQRGSNGTYPNWAYVVKDNTDGIYITGGSGTKSDKFTLAVHTK